MGKIPYVYKSIPKSLIPEGKSGDWEIKKFTVDSDYAALFNLRNAINSVHGRDIVVGDYTKLMHKDATQPMMSDTPAECRDHLLFVLSAEGNVLMNGLGLGLSIRAVLLKNKVDKVVVNEVDGDVIELVACHLKEEFGDKLKVNHVSAFDYRPNGIRFNTVWHDIWPDITLDNYDEYKKLSYRYSHWLKKPYFHDAWCYDLLKNMKRDRDNERGLYEGFDKYTELLNMRLKDGH